MGLMGSDFVAVGCIVAGGILGGLGWNALEVPPAEAPSAPTCSGVFVTAASAPDVVVRVGEDDRIVFASRIPEGSNVRLACGEVTATADELRVRTRRARIRVLDLRGELRTRHAPVDGSDRISESPR